ncbi:Hypothetical Protein FCC1311_055172 [Hondaea fermentalgiana]|uniref:Uncharacterized protein n=1 Tax=Hondaea fermentalgiana TaxID=2315210 RepID=A0A2R5GFF3_9STRA|nr:Hypothetical Protein FCC1311_055172 [Hondaea fermentalgiana]|eukprot:GBG29295.1 Hypothetical Protein FCC1311_055172 [Hondaea fermentalgiana]
MSESLISDDDTWTVVSSGTMKSGKSGKRSHGSTRQSRARTSSSASWIICQCDAKSVISLASSVASSTVTPSHALTNIDDCESASTIVSGRSHATGPSSAAVLSAAALENDVMSTVSTISYATALSRCPTCGYEYNAVDPDMGADEAKVDMQVFERIVAPRFQRPRFAAWDGKSTVRKDHLGRGYFDEGSDIVTIHRPRVNVVTALDALLFNAGCPPPKLRSSVTLAKGGRWILEQKFEKLALAPPIRSKTCNGDDQITYDLPIVGEVYDSYINASLAKQRESELHNRTIYAVVSRGNPFRVKTVGVYPAEAPDVGLRELDFRLRPSNMHTAQGIRVRNAKCRMGQRHAFFSPLHGNAGTSLEAHFDQPVTVCAVSTAARRPQFATFPDHRWLDDFRRKNPKKSWKGEWFHVFDNKHAHAHDELFFPEYKLSYRPNPGAPWIPLGTFKGPRDNFEERLQSLDGAANTNARSYIRCVALRWTVPGDLNEMSKRGLRVAVFAPPDAHNGRHAVTKPRDVASLGPARQGQDSTVRYVLSKASVSHRTLKKGTSSYASWGYDSEKRKGARRRKLGKETRRAVKEHLNGY